MMGVSLTTMLSLDDLLLIGVSNKADSPGEDGRSSPLSLRRDRLKVDDTGAPFRTMIGDDGGISNLICLNRGVGGGMAGLRDGVASTIWAGRASPPAPDVVANACVCLVGGNAEAGTMEDVGGSGDSVVSATGVASICMTFLKRLLAGVALTWTAGRLCFLTPGIRS